MRTVQCLSVYCQQQISNHKADTLRLVIKSSIGNRFIETRRYRRCMSLVVYLQMHGLLILLESSLFKKPELGHHFVRLLPLSLENSLSLFTSHLPYHFKRSRSDVESLCVVKCIVDTPLYR